MLCAAIDRAITAGVDQELAAQIRARKGELSEASALRRGLESALRGASSTAPIPSGANAGSAAAAAAAAINAAADLSAAIDAAEDGRNGIGVGRELLERARVQKAELLQNAASGRTGCAQALQQALDAAVAGRGLERLSVAIQEVDKVFAENSGAASSGLDDLLSRVRAQYNELQLLGHQREL
jgi:hypothetical protein